MYKFSICIPTYNYGKYIADCIESVLSQSFRNFELLIVDNASDDNTEEVVRNYIEHNANVRYFRNDVNIGMAANWNRCLSLSTGEYVKILCADDVLKPEHLNKCFEILDNNPNVVLITTGRLLTDEYLQPYDKLCYSDCSQIVNGHDVIKKCLIYGNLIGEPSSVIFKKNIAKRGFNTKYQQLTDLEMWFYILEQGDFGYLNEDLCIFRQHKDQATKENINNLVIDEDFCLLEEYLKKPYIKFTYCQYFLAKHIKAKTIWGLKNNNNKDKLKLKISQHYSFYIFIFCFYLVKWHRKIKRRYKKGLAFLGLVTQRERPE